MASYRFAILKNESSRDHLDWVAACEHSEHEIEFEIVDLSKSDWLGPFREDSFDKKNTKICMEVVNPDRNCESVSL